MWIPTPSNGDLSLYFHIPFCNHKCSYCHFYVIPNKTSFQKMLLESLQREIEQKADLIKPKKIKSIYFGGGTPALLDPKYFEQILMQISNVTQIDDCEITLECNPENNDYKNLEEFQIAGINRLSIGVQAFDGQLLKKIGRKHSVEDIDKILSNAGKAGFSNISIDLMYDLPTQTYESWSKTLQTTTQYPLTHISLYNLSIEPHTVFYKNKDRIKKQMPSSEISLKMFELACDFFKQKGFEHYEISAFCQHEKYSQHNVGYWLQRPHLGFGPSAYSYYNQERFQNMANINRYCKAIGESQSPVDYRERLDPQEIAKESLALHLRLVHGFDEKVFINRFGPYSESSDRLLEQLVDKKLAERKEGRYRLLFEGLLMHDAIASELM